MKKFLSLSLLLTIFCSLFISSNFICYADNEKITKECHISRSLIKGILKQDTNYASEEKKYSIIQRNIGCVMDIKIGQEIIIDGFKYKKVVITGNILEKGGGKPIAKNEIKVLFSYDGEKAYVNDPRMSIERNEKSLIKQLNILGFEQIFTSNSQCIISGEWSLIKHKGAINKVWESFNDLHIDIICNKDGKIEYNIKSIEDETETMCQEQVVKDEIVFANKNVLRKEVIKDYLYNTSLEETGDDVYKYITRQIEILYKDFAGNVKSSAVIEGNFRYNKAKNEVVCLSTYSDACGENGSRVDKNICARRCNERIDRGGAYAELNLKYEEGIFDDSFGEIITIKCNSKGEVSNKISVK